MDFLLTNPIKKRKWKALLGNVDNIETLPYELGYRNIGFATFETFAVEDGCSSVGFSYSHVFLKTDCFHQISLARKL